MLIKSVTEIFKKRRIISIGCLCFFIVFILGRQVNETNMVKTARVEVMVFEVGDFIEKTIVEQNIIDINELVKIQGSSEEVAKDEDEDLADTAIRVYHSFIQFEVEDGSHQLIEFPRIYITDAYDIANRINEQIYNEIIPEDFGQYKSGRVDIDIHYEVEILDEKIMSIHFLGYLAYWGSYAECDKGLNFNLQTGEMISLKDYYTLSDIREIVNAARDKNEINVIFDIPLDKTEKEQQIDNFTHLFDSEEYVNRKDIFFLKNNHIYFITPPIESMRQSIYMEISLGKFSEL